MSGKPCPEGVTLFRQALARMSQLSKERGKLHHSIERDKALLEQKESEYRAAHNEVFKFMQEMDVHASGNYGYEGRMAWFLIELFDQLERARGKQC